MARDHTTPIVQELTSSGSESVTLVPGSTTQTGTFNIAGIDPVTDGKRNYATGFWGHLQTVFDADAAGNAISADKLGKCMSSWRLFSPILGEVFPSKHTRGSVLYNLIQVMALGYNQSQPARAQIAANTDADTTIDLYYFLPLSYEFLKKPHEASQWVGFFDQGLLEGSLDVSTALDGDYSGGVLKATTQLRAWVEYMPSPDIALGVPVQWREREIAGGGSQPTLVGVGQETQLTGVRPGCGLAFLGWLTDATGIGLGGPDGVDNITQFELPWRNQKLVRNLDPVFLNLRRSTAHRVGPVAGTGSTIIHDGAGWPSTMDSTPNNRPGANSQQLMLPLVFPGLDAETSKFQRVNGNLKINFTTTAAISSAHKFLTCEFMEYEDRQVDTMFRAMGVSPSAYHYHRKALLDNSPNQEKLRYTRIIATRKAG
jgi:hypothetical protein